MRSALLAALMIATALAGCAGGSDDGGGAGASASSQSTTTTGPPPKPVVYSDTLHLMAAPDMVLVLPDGGSDIKTGTAGNFGPGGGGGNGNDGPPSQWAYQVGNFSNITGAEVHVWIDIKEQMYQAPSFDPRSAGQASCTWYVRIALGADGEPEMSCKSEPVGIIAAGVKELVFDVVGLDVELEANETIAFTFGRTVFSTSQGDSVEVLSGSSTHDSRLVVKGLKEVVPGK